MKKRIIKIIDTLLIVSLLFTQSFSALAESEVLSSPPEAVTLAPAEASSEGNDTSKAEAQAENTETLPVSSTLEKEAEAILENKVIEPAENTELKEGNQALEKATETGDKGEERSAEPLLASLAPRILPTVTTEKVLDYTEGFTYFIDPGLPEAVKENDKLYLEWHYKLTTIKPPNMTGRFLGKLYNYFSTTKDSGLGQPVIREVTKNGVRVTNYITLDTANVPLMKAVTATLDPKLDRDTTEYEFIVRASVEEIRDHYAMDFNAEVLFNVPATSTIADPTSSTGTRVLLKDEVIKLSNTRRESINATTSGDSNLRAINSLGDSVYLKSTIGEEQIIAGDYTSEKTITWLISQTNIDKTEKEFPVRLDVDSSQRIESVKVYYYKPDTTKGYVLDRVETRDKNLASLTLPAGYTAQVEVKTTVMEDKVNHTLGEAELESLIADLTIQKTWQEGSTPKDVQFTLTGGKDNQLNERVTIRANGTPYVKVKQPKFTGFDKNAKRLFYEVEELKSDAFELVFSSFNEKTLSYTFENKTKQEDVLTGECTDYGVIAIDPIIINEYFSQSRDGREIHSYGGKLTGTFRIPKEAKAGDYFILELPKELKIRDVPDLGTKFFDIYGNSQKIGEVFHYEQNKLKFVLNENAYSTTDYEGTFQIGQKINLRDKGVRRIDGSTRFDTKKEYFTGIEPERIYFNHPTEPQAQTVSKRLTFNTTYFDRKRIDENCNKTLAQTGKVSYADPELNYYGGIYKTVSEIGDDYVSYDLVFNSDGRNGWADGLFIEQLTDTIELYSGNRASSLLKDIQIYEVIGLRNRAYVAGSEKEIYPSRDRRATSMVNVGWNDWSGSASRKTNVYGGMRNVKPTDHITFQFSNTGTKTILVRMKTKLSSGYEKKYNGNFYNFLWTDKKNKFGATIFDNSKYDFMGVEENLTSGSANGTITIKEQYFELNLEKVDLKNQPITNNTAVFQLKDKDGLVLGEYFTEKTGQLTIGGLKRYIKERDGTSKGIYYLEEVQAPSGYVRDGTIYKILIDNEGTIYFGKKGSPQNEDEFLHEVDARMPIKIVNKNAFLVKVKKVDENQTPLVGARFNLKNHKETYNVTTPSAKVQSEFTFYNLDIGSYTLTEVEAPEGYQGLKSPISFKVKDNGEIELISPSGREFETRVNEDERTFEFLVVNKKLKNGEFTINKVSPKGEPLEGAIFRLTPIAPQGTVIEKKSNVIGKAIFTNLNAGQYRLEEIQAPKGYEKTKTTWLVEVDEFGKTTVKVEATNALVQNKSNNPNIVIFDVINKKDPFGFELPKTGGKGVTLIKVFGLLVILGAGYLLLRKKKKP